MGPQPPLKVPPPPILDVPNALKKEFGKSETVGRLCEADKLPGSGFYQFLRRTGICSFLGQQGTLEVVYLEHSVSNVTYSFKNGFFGCEIGGGMGFPASSCWQRQSDLTWRCTHNAVHTQGGL